jgi:glutathione peroxidase
MLGLAGGVAALGGTGVRAQTAQRMPGGLRFASIDGGDLALDDWAGRPILVVNTASRCGYTGQYEGLQALHERYREAGLVVLAVPSGDFRQELETAEAVKEFCTLTFGLDLPMTDITHVRGASAHPLYRWLREAHDFSPRWNFNKVLIGRDGAFVGAWGSNIRPSAPVLTRAVEAALAGA